MKKIAKASHTHNIIAIWYHTPLQIGITLGLYVPFMWFSASYQQYGWHGKPGGGGGHWGAPCMELSEVVGKKKGWGVKVVPAFLKPSHFMEFTCQKYFVNLSFQPNLILEK